MQEANLIFFGICYTNMLFMIPAKYQNLSKCTFVFRYSFSFKMWMEFHNFGVAFNVTGSREFFLYHHYHLHGGLQV